MNKPVSLQRLVETIVRLLDERGSGDKTADHDSRASVTKSSRSATGR
jgi:hypothetical protein